MVNYNLPSHMIQHWTYVHELNETLKDLVKFLAVGYAVVNRPLNPKVIPYIYKGSEVQNIPTSDTVNSETKGDQGNLKDHGTILNHTRNITNKENNHNTISINEKTKQGTNEQV